MKLATIFAQMSKEKREANSRTDSFFSEEDKGKKWSAFADEVARKSFAKALARDPRSDEKLALHADRLNRLATGKVLGTIHGDTGTYEIKKLRGGGLGCTCNDWRYTKSIAPSGEMDCKHITQWRKEHKKEAEYSEGPTSTFTHAGQRYSVDSAIAAGKTKPVEQVPLTKLTWILRHTSPDPARVQSSDTSVPTLGIEWGDKVVIVDGLHRLAKASAAGEKTLPVKMLALSDLVPHKKEAAMLGAPQAHQLDSLEHSKGTSGQLLLHGLGSGKSYSALMQTEHRGGNVLMVTPASLRENMQGQLLQHVTPDRHQNYHIMSYEKFKKDPEGHVARIKPTSLVVDEVHRLRNSGPRQAFQKVRDKVPYMVGLTGSAVNNRPEELVPLLNLISGKKLYTEEEFARKHIKERKVGPGLLGRLRGVKPGTVEEGANLEEMAARLSPYVHRFTGSKEYSANVPEVTESEVRVPMSPKQEQIYAGVAGSNPVLAYKVRKNLPPSKKELENMNAFMSALRQVSNDPSSYDPSLTRGKSPKMQAMLQDIREKAKDDPDFRSVIYSNYLQSGVEPMVEQLNAEGTPSEAFTGKLTDKKRKDLVERYNNGGVKVLGLSPAGGEGLDLKGTRLVQLTEEHWNPERVRQAIGRAARFKSHEHLPEEKRKVEVKRYLATHAPKWYHKFVGKPEMSADEWINQRRQEKLKLNQQFVNALPSFTPDDE